MENWWISCGELATFWWTTGNLLLYGWQMTSCESRVAGTRFIRLQFQRHPRVASRLSRFPNTSHGIISLRPRACNGQGLTTTIRAATDRERTACSEATGATPAGQLSTSAPPWGYRAVVGPLTRGFAPGFPSLRLWRNTALASSQRRARHSYHILRITVRFVK